MVRQKTVFITGATDGIGLSLARIHHEMGCRLVLTGRRPLESLEEPFFSAGTYCQADLEGADYCPAILEFLHRQAIDSLDLCIQNAATSDYGPIADQSPTGIRQVVAVNLMAPIHLSRMLLPHLAKRGGKLVFIGSVASYLPCPEYAVYAATKSALNGLARSLRVEMAGKVRVQVIHPGATRTGFHRKAGIPKSRLATDRFPSADDVAGKITRGITRERVETVIGANNVFLAWLGRRFRRPLESLMRRRTA